VFFKFLETVYLITKGEIMNKGFREFNKKAERLAGIKESRFLKRKSRKKLKGRLLSAFVKGEIKTRRIICYLIH